MKEPIGIAKPRIAVGTAITRGWFSSGAGDGELGMVSEPSSDFPDRLLYAQTHAALDADHDTGTSCVGESVATSRGVRGVRARRVRRQGQERELAQRVKPAADRRR